MADTSADARARILTTPNPDRAEHWVRVLDDAGIDALVELMDAQLAEPGGSPLVGVLGSRPLEFLHVLTVTAEDRDHAVTGLIDAGWNGREGSPVRGRTTSRDIVRPLAVIALVVSFFLLLRVIA